MVRSLSAVSSPASAAARPDQAAHQQTLTVLSFDVEEHYRIEAAAGLPVSPEMKTHCQERVITSTHWLLDRLGEYDIRATFFVVGQIARHSPALVRAIHQAGHEVASHGWEHRRLHGFHPEAFRADLRQSRDALEQATGQAVVGYRAPTFSIMQETAWAIDVLAEEGLRYDSSIYPVRHDRYGVPQAPRGPFRAAGPSGEILELPPLTWRVLGLNVPVGGGGSFRLLPLSFVRYALGQMERGVGPTVAMLYFHPWEFDLEQARMPMGRVNSFRTYFGIARTARRLDALVAGRTFARAMDAVAQIEKEQHSLPRFELVSASAVSAQ